MKKNYAWSALLQLPAVLIIAAVLSSTGAEAQLSVAAAGTTYTITFDATMAGVNNAAYTGTGFQAVPGAGRLDSDAWASTGMSDGNLAFGGANVTGDYARGTTAPGNAAVTTAGFYSFGGGSITGRALGIQPSLPDFTPGTVTLRVKNNTGLNLTAFDLAYKLHIRNDGGFANSFNCAWSADNVTFTNVPALAHTSTQAAGASVFVANLKSTTLTGFIIPAGGFFYIRWSGDDVSGSGTRDEFALDDIAVTGYARTALRFVSTTSTANEDGGTHLIAVGIVNASVVNPTTVDVALSSGDATRIGNYTTQTLSWPANNSANQNLSVTLSDNGACDGNVNEVFQLQSATGGNVASVGAPSAHTLTVDDDETDVVTITQQAFDSGVNDTWSITAGAGNISSNTGAGEFPPLERILSPTMSWQTSNSTNTLDLGAFSCLGYTSVVVRVRLSSISTNNANGSDVGDFVRVYADVDGAGFPGTPDIQVEGNSNARWGFSTGTGVASTAAGTPLSVAPAAGGNRTTDGYSYLNVSIPNGSSTVALRVVAINNAAVEFWNVDNVVMEGVRCRPIYFSRASGATTGSIWSTSRTGLPAASTATFDCNATMVIQSPDVVAMGAGPFNLYELYVETASTLNLTASPDIDLCGNTMDVDGAVTGSIFDEVEFLNTAAGTLSGDAVAVNFETLIANGQGLTVVGLDTVNIWTELRVDNNNFNASATRLNLRSDAGGTARLAPVIAPDSYTGQLTLERHIPAGVTNWRSLACPIVGKNIASWKDDFYTAGFPGSHFPGFMVGGNPWPSIRHYNEANAGPLIEDGLVGVTGTGMQLTLGKGFAAWAGDNLNTTNAFTIDVSGTPNIPVAPFTLPMTWTNNGFATTDGWNLVGNPLPSPIDFTDVVLGADVDNFYYVFNPVSGNNAAWDEGLGVSIPGGELNGNIQSAQGFWLKANGPAVTTTVDENAKVLDLNGGGLFGGDEDAPKPMFRVKITSAINPYFDETVVYFGSGAPAFGDEHDIGKFTFGHPEAPALWSKSSDGQDLILNAWGELANDATLPVCVKVGVSGMYTLKVYDAQGVMGSSCLVLEDQLTGTTTTLTDGAEYSFTISSSDAAEPARFLVHASAVLPRYYEPATCAGAADGQATVVNTGSTPIDITWMDAFGNVQLVQSQVAGVGAWTGLVAGSYLVQVSNTGCGSLTEAFTIDEPPVLDAVVGSTASTCAAEADGSLDLTVMGGTAPYTYAWSNGSTDEDLVNEEAGTYDVTISDANGCTHIVNDLMVTAGPGPSASFLASNTLAYVGDTLYFFNTSTYGVQYTWNYGDGSTGTDGDGEHIYTMPGNYTVVLTVTDGECTATVSADIVISGSTGLVQLVDGAVEAYSDANGFVFQWNLADADDLSLTILDGRGRELMARSVNASMGTERFDAMGMADGIYYLRVASGTEQRTFKLLLVR